MGEDAGLDLDFDAGLEGEVIAVQRASDPELGGKPEPAGRTVTLGGKQFRVSSKVGLMPLLKFAHAASRELDTSDMRAFDALYEMLHDVIQEPVPPCGKCADCKAKRADECVFADKGDWDAFERHAVACKAEAEELLDVVGEAIALLTARPTGQPSRSSGSSRDGSGNSTGSRSGRRAAGSNGSARGRRAISR